MILWTSFSVPTLLFPTLATSRFGDNYYTSIVFSSFAIGCFPASLLSGKLMRFSHKDKLLVVTNILCSISRILFGLTDYIENEYFFFIFALGCRFLTGLCEGLLTPIYYSCACDLFPDEIAEKIGILELYANIGIILGGPMATLFYETCGYFAVFAIFGFSNLIFGTLIIICFLKTDEIPVFKQEEKQSLSIKKALFSSKDLLLTFFYGFFYWFPNFAILPSYQNYMSTLTSSLYVSAFIYVLKFVGFIIGIIFLKMFNKTRIYEQKMMVFFGIIGIFGLLFYGPEPAFGITNNTTKLILIGISFTIVAMAVQIIFLILCQILIDELLDIFPGEKKLCADFANGLFICLWSIDELFGPLVGGALTGYFGYDRSATLLALITFIYFVFYWLFIGNKKSYHNLNEEKEVTDNVKKEDIT